MKKTKQVPNETSWEEMVAAKLGLARRRGSKITVDTFVNEALSKKQDQEWKKITQDEQNSWIDSYNAFGAPLSHHRDAARATHLVKILKKAEELEENNPQR